MEDLSRGELNDLIAKFAGEDAGYRQAVLDNPKSVIEQQTGSTLPDSMNVKVVQESSDTVYLVLPHQTEEGAELDDADLEKVAGGKLDKISCSAKHVAHTNRLKPHLGTAPFVTFRNFACLAVPSRQRFCRSTCVRNSGSSHQNGNTAIIVNHDGSSR